MQIQGPRSEPMTVRLTYQTKSPPYFCHGQFICECWLQNHGAFSELTSYDQSQSSSENADIGQQVQQQNKLREVKKKSHQNAIRTKSVSTAQYFALKHPVVWPWAIQKRCQWKEDAWALWRRTLLVAPPLPPASPSPCLSVNCRSPEMTCKHIYIHHNLNLDKSMDMDKYLIN